MIDWKSIPIWLRCTDRHKIDPNVRGSIYGTNSESYNRKLSEEQVRLVRSGEISLHKLATEWGVSYSTLYGVRTGDTYKDAI